MIESLEGRRLLAADLTVEFVGAVPASVKLSGANHVTVRVTNVGNSPASGTATITVYASVDTALDIRDTALSATVTRKVHLRPNAGMNVPMKFAFPTGVAAGSYYLVADIVPSAAVGDTNAADKIVAAASLISIQNAFVDLTDSVATNVQGLVTVGGKHQKPLPIAVVVTNNGNVKAHGPLTIDLYAATHMILNPSDTLLMSKTVGTVTIGPGKSKTEIIRVVPNAGEPSGTFYLLAEVNPNNSIAESDTANNIASSAYTFVINNPAIAPGPFLESGLTSSLTSTYVNEGQQTEFNVTLGRAGSSTTIEVEEFDSTGKELGPITPLYDNGSSANGDAAANDGIYSGLATLDSSVAGTRYFAAILTDPQFGGTKQTPTISIPVTVHPAPTLGGPLNSDVSTVIIGHAELVQFNVQVTNASPSTAVEVDEFDVKGNDLGKLVDLLDDGSSAAGDRTAGDGIYSGVNTIGFTAPGTRYFAAVVSDSVLLASPLQTPTLAIMGENPPSQASLQTDITDNNNLSQVAANVIDGGGTEAAAIAAVQAALQSDSNVQPTTIGTTATSIEWETIDGTWQGVSTDFLTSGANATLGAPAPAATVASGTPRSVAPADDTSTLSDPTLTALLLSPYASSLSQYDPSADIDGQFTAANYTVTYHSDAEVTLDDFKNLGQYDAVNIYSHGAQLTNGGEGIYTSIPTSVATSAANSWDLVNNRLVLMNGYYVVTPSFITAYAGAMDGTIVMIDACNSLHDTQLGDAFMNLGAGAYIGFTQSVKAGFAATKSELTWQTLLGSANNTVGDIPGINTDQDTNTPPAVFMEDGPLTATLPQPNLLKNYVVLVEYNWPQDVNDLDSNTMFLGSTAGYHLDNNSPFLMWSGDNTGAGGDESTIVNIYQAWLAGAWANTTSISAGADWYTPAGGAGPAFITIALQNIKTGKLTYIANEKVVSPGQETLGAATVVATVNVVLGGNATDPSVKISLT